MATKALNINQHIPLHDLYPDNCCLCKAEQKIKELECILSSWYTVFGTMQLTHAQDRLEQAEREVKQLTNQLETKQFLSKEICDICHTSSYTPVPKSYKGSLKVKGKNYNVICQMCEADERMIETYKIFKWLLGLSDEGFPQRNKNEGLYFWRKELRKKLEKAAIKIKENNDN